MTTRDWLLTLAFVVTWCFGFVSGKWWERTKNNPPPSDNDEIWW